MSRDGRAGEIVSFRDDRIVALCTRLHPTAGAAGSQPVRLRMPTFSTEGAWTYEASSRSKGLLAVC